VSIDNRYGLGGGGEVAFWLQWGEGGRKGKKGSGVGQKVKTLSQWVGQRSAWLKGKNPFPIKGEGQLPIGESRQFTLPSKKVQCFTGKNETGGGNLFKGGG